MTKVFHIRALNSPNGDFREVELDLPATDYVLLDAMEQLRLEDGKRPYLEFHAAEEYDYLNKRIQEADIFRLNALAKRLAGLDMRGMAVFWASSLTLFLRTASISVWGGTLWGWRWSSCGPLRNGVSLCATIPPPTSSFPF